MIAEAGPSDAAAAGGPSGGGARRTGAAAHSAFVLHSYDWSETSLIVELFTRDAGRVAAAAKGAKRPTSQLRALLMPFQLVSVQFARTRGDAAAEVRTLRSAEWGGGAVINLHGPDWFTGFYLNELVLRLLARDDPHARLFDAYAGTLRSLGHGEARSEAALRAFELVLLRETGVLPDLAHTTLTQQPLSPGLRYALHPEQGLVDAAARDASLGSDTWLELATALQSWTASDDDALPALQRACARESQALKVLLRNQLHYHLGGVQLRTRQLATDTQRLLDSKAPPR